MTLLLLSMFIFFSSIACTACFAAGERLAAYRRGERRRLIIMGLQAQLDERDETARNNWN